MRSVEIRAGARAYQALIGAGLLEKTGELVRPFFRGARCALVADDQVASLYGDKVLASLRAADFSPELIQFPAGEASKSIAQAAAIGEQLSRAGLDRSSFLVSLGGGVAGDLVGFVAAIYHRGIPYVSLPTTLLAQVDSSIGGKTGVNTLGGKNLLGCFHHPTLVVADVDTLRALPPRVWNEGFAEIIKHGIIRDAELFRRLDELELTALVERSLAVKAALVGADEREETGERALLNFGHTIGHAIEHAAAPGGLLHGEAISLGMVAAAGLSVRRAGLSLGERDQIIAALQSHQLPVALPPGFPREKIFQALARDKKFANGQVRFVVAHEIGRASVSEAVTMDDLQFAVGEL